MGGVVVVLALVVAMQSVPVPAEGAEGGAAGAEARRAASEPGLVVGRVESEEAPVPFARVEVRGSGEGAVADSAGTFRLRLPAGRHVLLATAMGWGTGEAPVEVVAGGVVRVTVRLRTQAVSLNPIVVTGTRKAVFVSESPVKVDVVTSELLSRRASASLMESIGQVNGLYQQIDCGVCYTNNIRINGMEGPYTAVLIDGMPLMSALASVYGLNGINPSLVERLEVIKGPASTLYGPEAMGGVVNVITKDARFSPRLVADARVTSSGQQVLDVAAAPWAGDWSGLVSGSLVHRDRFVDANGDGFSDVPLETRLSLFGRADRTREGRTVWSVAGKAYREDRFGGVDGWTESDRGSGAVYGESILTDRVELLGTWVPVAGVRAEGSYTGHRQDSWYGDQRFRASQTSAYGALLLDVSAEGHDGLVGLTARHSVYDDDTPATAVPERRLIPGVFVQDEVRVRPDLRVLAGLRVDHHAHHGWILSPRLSGKWQAGEETAVRVNAGTGFRVVHVFTEDHAALTGAREVVVDEALEPERSVSVAANLNQGFHLWGGEAMVDVDAFYTRFGNRILPDYDTDPRRIHYRNLDGHAVSRGVAVALNHLFLRPALSYDLGLTVQDVYVEEAGEAGAAGEARERRRQLFSPRFTAVASAGWTPRPGLSLDYTARLTGPMRLPEYPAPFTRPTRSPTHAIHDLQATLDLSDGATVYAGVRNLFDYTQGSPLVDPANPFGDAFDTTYVWGPILGRELVLGARLGVSR